MLQNKAGKHTHKKNLYAICWDWKILRGPTKAESCIIIIPLECTLPKLLFPELASNIRKLAFKILSNGSFIWTMREFERFSDLADLAELSKQEFIGKCQARRKKGQKASDSLVALF